MERLYNRHYIRADGQGRVTEGWSDGPLPGKDTSGAVCIRKRGGYPFRLSPDGEENPALTDRNGVPLYRWDGTRILPRPAEESTAEAEARRDDDE